MDKLKARRLVLKIQTFLEPEVNQELSRLEKDLVRSYILQLYEAVQDEEVHKSEIQVKSQETYFTPKIEVHRPEVKAPTVKEIVPEPPVEIPQVKVQKPVEIPVEIKYPEPEVTYTPPKQEYKPVEPPVQEPVKEKAYTPPPTIHVKEEQVDEGLLKLFEQRRNDDVADRFSHVPIPSIEGAMGLNERIFTLKELFGGDKFLFDSTCERLNNLQSFSEARQLLLQGAAKQYKWSDPERIKMAEQFIRIVSRRYPKSEH